MNADGTPGPHFSKATQYQAIVPYNTTFFISLPPDQKVAYDILPEPTLNFAPIPKPLPPGDNSFQPLANFPPGTYARKKRHITGIVFEVAAFHREQITCRGRCARSVIPSSLLVIWSSAVREGRSSSRNSQSSTLAPSAASHPASIPGRKPSRYALEGFFEVLLLVFLR